MNKNFALIIASGFIISSLILGTFFYKKQTQQGVRVVGMASERVMSDRIKWTLSLGKKISLTNSEAQFIECQQKYLQLKDFILAKGIKESEIILKPISSFPSYGQNGTDGYMVEQTLMVISDNIELIESLAFDLTQIYKQGLIVQSSAVSYHIDDLAKIKQNLLEKATKDALFRAESIAGSVNCKVGRIIEANTGVFQINERYSTDITGYGVYNTSVKEKEISVTVRASFRIKK